MSVEAPLAESADADFLREMIGFAAQRLMDLEVGSLTAAGYGVKSSDGLAQRKRLPRARL
jgi:putative transposase